MTSALDTPSGLQHRACVEQHFGARENSRLQSWTSGGNHVSATNSFAAVTTHRSWCQVSCHSTLSHRHCTYKNRRARTGPYHGPTTIFQN